MGFSSGFSRVIESRQILFSVLTKYNTPVWKKMPSSRESETAGLSVCYIAHTTWWFKAEVIAPRSFTKETNTQIRCFFYHPFCTRIWLAPFQNDISALQNHVPISASKTGYKPSILLEEIAGSPFPLCIQPFPLSDHYIILFVMPA